MPPRSRTPGTGLTLTGRVIYTSAQYYDLANSQKIPDWATLDVGLRYATTQDAAPGRGPVVGAGDVGDGGPQGQRPLLERRGVALPAVGLGGFLTGRKQDLPPIGAPVLHVRQTALPDSMNRTNLAGRSVAHAVPVPR
jgi:hypothetical protein